MTETSNSLKHWGILGMKWGVRHDKKSSRPVKPSEDYLLSRDIQKKNIVELTNAEITALNTRLKLENSYRENIKTYAKAHRSLGRKVVEDILIKAGKDAATDFVKKQISKSTEKALNSIFNKVQKEDNK